MLSFQIIKTEVVRHIFTGGKLNIDGSESPGIAVLEEARSCQSFRKLLGIEEDVVSTGLFTFSS